MPTTTRGARALLRLSLAALGLWLAALAIVHLFIVGRSATDENVFIDLPSTVYVTDTVAGRVGTAPRDRRSPARAGAARRRGAPSLEPGDLVVAVDAERVKSVPAARAALARPGPLEVVAYRAGRNRLLAVVVDPSTLSDALRSVENTVLVVAVRPEGASDRAGMRVGDLITRINAQGFSTMLEADRIMRFSEVDRETTYDILRGGAPLSLQVRLAFGLPLGPVLLFVVGLLYIAAGTLLATLRTHIKAALYLGLGWMGSGFAMALVLSRPRRTLPTWYLLTSDVFLGLCVGFGVAAWLHALHYFPRERSALIARTWAKRGAYTLASVVAISTVGLTWWAGRDGLFLIGMLVMLTFAAVATARTRQAYSPEDRQISRPTSIATGVSVGFTLVVFALGGLGASVGRNLPGAPLLGLLGATLHLGTLVVYLLVIGRYRLLESDLRVRRNVQYLVVSTAWTLLVVGAGLGFWWLMMHTELPLPNVRLTGQAIEVLPTPVDPARRALIEKGVLIAAAVVFAYAFRALLKRGHRFLAEQYYQEGYDYRRATQELSEVMGPRMDLDGLADGLLTVIDRLMPVKRAGVVFVQGQRVVTSKRSIGFETGDWDIFCAGCVHEAITVLTGARGAEMDTEYAPPRLRLSLRRAEIHHLYPIGGHNELRGVLFIGEKLSESAYTADDFAFLGVIASQAALLVENAFLYENLAAQERVRQELAIARRIQLESLPQRAPQVAGLEIAGVSLPAQEVGGDYFDYLDGAAGSLTVMIGDVSGKGTSAALYMSKLQGIVRSLHGFGLTPRQLFVRINDLLGRDLDRRAFVTALGAFFDTTARTLVLVRAGHLPLLHFRAATGEVARWLPRGLGLGLANGVLFGSELEECRIAYAPGDVFLFVTDGITESHNVEGEDYGEDRLVAQLGSLASARASVDAMLSAVSRGVSEFAIGAPQQDDQTVVVIRAQ